jgi:hypothetical protein
MFLGAILCFSVANQATAYNFTATHQGQTIYYNITSQQSPLTVEVTYDNPPGFGESNCYVGNIVIPSTVTYNNNTYTVTGIGISAFSSCYNLISVTIPNTVKIIKMQAFFDCRGLTSITIPSSVDTIRGEVFSWVTSKLNEIRMQSTTPPSIVENTFQETNGIRLHVPCGSQEAYQNDVYWSTFANITDDVSSNNISVQSNNATMGTVAIKQINTCINDTVIIEATPKTGYRFVQWNDGNKQNLRTVIVTQNITYTAEFESLTAITDIESSAINIYPNPATDNINVMLPEDMTNAVFTLYNMQGKTLIRQEISNHYTVPINDIAKGLYIYHVTTDKQNYQGKIIRK